MSLQFNSWIKKSGLDPQFGYLIPKEYKPRHFNKAPIVRCLSNLIGKLQSLTFCSFADKMEDVQFVFKTEQDPNDQFLVRDCLMLHGMLNKIIGAYLLEKQNLRANQQDIVIQRNIGLPLYQVSKFLKMKYGLTTDFYFNWQIEGVDTSKQLPEQIDVRDVRLLQNFHNLKIDQDLFFGGSVVGSHYLFLSIKDLFQVNQNIVNIPFESQDENIRLLEKVAGNIKKMVQTNTYLFQTIKKQLFSPDFRKAFSGFQNLKFQGIGQKLSSKGGAGGLDPLFQLFQRIMKIKYQNGEKTAQQVFQQGFPETILKLFEECQEKFQIRQYCQLTEQLKEAYNGIIGEYSNFYSLHKSLIMKYVLASNPKAVEGAAGVKLHDILNRGISIAQHRL